MNLGTIGDDPVQLANDMRATVGEIRARRPACPMAKWTSAASGPISPPVAGRVRGCRRCSRGLQK